MIRKVLRRIHQSWSPVVLQQVLHTQQHISSSSVHSSSGTASSSFAFAAAASDSGNLFKAIQDAAKAVQVELQGRSIDFCQLFVTTAHRSTLSHAPECLMDNLKANAPDGQPFKCPVIIGGAVQSVYAHGQSVCSAPGVSLLAASLPGVELLPFHVKTATLPTFNEQQWARLLQLKQFDSNSSSSSNNSICSSNSPAGADSSSSHGGGGSSSSDDSCAAIILSSPHFVEVEKLLQRFSHALPSMAVVGGVTEPSAWVDTEHQYGALFCGTDVYCLGAVGCLMVGPLTMQQLLVPGCRPAGRMMTVTKAMDNHIISLDGQPVHDALVSLIHSLPEGDQKKRELLLGLLEPQYNSSAAEAAVAAGAAVDSRALTARHMSLSTTTRGSPILTVASHEVMVGTRVQLMLRDDAGNNQQQEAAFKDLAVQLGGMGSQAGILSYCCAALPPVGSSTATVLSQLPFAGGSMQGEFAGPESTWIKLHASLEEASPTGNSHSMRDTSSIEPKAAEVLGGESCAKLHSYAASYAVLHHSGLAVVG